MPKPPDGHLVADTPVRQTRSTNKNAPTTAIAEAALQKTLRKGFRYEY